MTVEPLRLSLPVACAPAHAFRAWTERIDSWWPRSHSESGDPSLTVVIEARLGGRIFERTSAGTEYDWGVITVWEPPRRLGYRWHLRSTPDRATDVLVSFVEVAADQTRIDIEHASWERLGDDASAWRDRNDAGWAGLLPHFVDHLERNPT